MTQTGQPRRLRPGRIALAAAGVGMTAVVAVAAWGPTETIASFADNVWAGAGFGTGTFGIESSLSQTGEYENHTSDSPLTLHYGTPVSLHPGEVAYSALYIRRNEVTESRAVVSVSGPTGAENSWDALWNTHISFVAKAAPAALTPTCDSSIHNGTAWIDLYDSGTLAAPSRVDDATFTLGEPVGLELQTGEPYMVCFEFTLSENVDSGSNGQSVFPVWTFTAESQQHS